MQTQSIETDRPTYAPIIIAGLLLGIGEGGFFDGIVLHQLLQWHHMFTSVVTKETVGGMELNTLGDGLFHVFDWVMTIAGTISLWRAGRRPDVAWSTGAFVGSILMGFGLFNLVEGVIDHHILQIHHVRAGANQLAWDLGFLAIGLALLLGGWLLVQRSRSHPPSIAD
ncbi:DUF2243 domain-containing protein [Leptolyngbya sp. FACHB-36]|uniref:DUF2243 domain-containing protein n=1 Tax=Leptolyngbya sp. FACHB-36 TaxID=2692808 RepID=UPI001680E99E|nr:DUF2243 domain-containing protein [Leptolyngbya sp. FACHB-36]MBD2019940.1 DUF2243 domain-containing protein [Leptolyngbya sp. FACHB-36]